VDDVDLHAQVLMIQGSKGGKSRLVPITPSAAAGLAQYAEQRDRLLAHRKTSAVLLTPKGLRIPGDRARKTFARLCQPLGLRPCQPGRSGRGPRLQEFRHTFATRQLIAWYRAGKDVNRLMPQLTTELGHGRPSSGMAARAKPLGICKLFQSCSHSPPSVCWLLEEVRGHECNATAGAHSALLHRAVTNAAWGEPA
jgi:hypothetical protein